MGIHPQSHKDFYVVPQIWYMAKQLSDGRVLCEQCTKEWDAVGRHWGQSKKCEYPELEGLKKEILIGLLMGDGSIMQREATNQYLRVNMITEPFLDWLDVQLGWLSTGVRLQITAKENALKSRESGFDSDALEENYNDVHFLRTRTHPSITELTQWYQSGKKVWPVDLELTPTALLMWYVGDGCFHNNGGKRYVTIAMSNEREYKNKVEYYFEGVEVPKPSYWSESERHDGTFNCAANWTVSDSKQLFEYMSQSPFWNGPPPGFEYKSPIEYQGGGPSMDDVDIKASA